MLREFAVGETRFPAGARTDGRGGGYCEQIVNDIGLGRYFEAARTGRIFTLSTTANFTLDGHASPIGAAGTPVLALFNPPSNIRAAVILKASCLLVPGASATPIIPVWNFLTNLTGLLTLGNQAALPAILSSTGYPGTMRSFVGLAPLTGSAVAQTFLRPWACNFNDPRHAGAASETAGGVLVEETDGSIIVPPGVILSVAFNVAGVAVTGCVSVVYAEIDWELTMGGPGGPPSSLGALIDSYSESNRSEDQFVNNNANQNSAIGQCFTGTGVPIGSCQFYLAKSGSPTGNAVVKVFAIAGTFGTSGLPTGAALATSDNFDVSTLPTSQALVSFTFSGANQIMLTNGTHYALSLEYTNGDGTNKIVIADDATSPTHPGNAFYKDVNSEPFYSVAGFTADVPFYVYST